MYICSRAGTAERTNGAGEGPAQSRAHLALGRSVARDEPLGNRNLAVLDGELQRGVVRLVGEVEPLDARFGVRHGHTAERAQGRLRAAVEVLGPIAEPVRNQPVGVDLDLVNDEALVALRSIVR